jgi:hypothetical protein
MRFTLTTLALALVPTFALSAVLLLALSRVANP